MLPSDIDRRLAIMRSSQKLVQAVVEVVVGNMIVIEYEKTRHCFFRVRLRGPQGTQQGTQPQGTQPQGTQPQGKQPQGTQPQGTQPQHATSRHATFKARNLK
ncbi:hypothetical protein BC938DRAFT_473423, partial [Jimgerdemannia flammicorona]